MTGKPSSESAGKTPWPQDMSMEKASLFLRLGMSAPRRPVDDLIDRLNQPDGKRWLPGALEDGPMRGMGTPLDLLVNGKATVQQCMLIKDHSKVFVRKAMDNEAKMAGIAGYFLAIAAGLRHHGVLLTARERAGLRDILLDLAEALAEPYRALVSQAALSAPAAGSAAGNQPKD
ncbi:MAG: hypothetical protein L0Y44_00035 [Phycisphaerales bacterium]|nr:hypothetical protein [Phycisphaerales bacterium]MCI0629026.1 hypothetical protein [Phycisphaerales bacterium]MCI0674783.1 hypothetical protein [Phycisphaerales bacterium]